MIPLALRLKAARALGGYESAVELAKAIDTPGLGVGPLRAMEQGKREARVTELIAIAAACGLREDFFDLPLERERTLPDVASRVRAARILGGYSSVEVFAATLDRDGLGDRTLRAIESGKRAATKDELATIATACGVPATFFAPDFFSAESENPDVRRLETKVDALLGHLGVRDGR